MVTMNGDESAILPVVSSVATLDHNLDDDDDDGMSDGSSHYDDGTDLMSATMDDEVTAQLAAAGTKLTAKFWRKFGIFSERMTDYYRASWNGCCRGNSFG